MEPLCLKTVHDDGGRMGDYGQVIFLFPYFCVLFLISLLISVSHFLLKSTPGVFNFFILHSCVPWPL